MKDAIGEGKTRTDHPDLPNQLYAADANVQDVRDLAAIIGEDELSETDKDYLEFIVGSVAERVIRFAHCPVLVRRGQD